MRTRVSLGLRACNTYQPRPSFSRPPGRRFSISTSASPSNCLIKPKPSADLRSNARDFLLRDCRYHHSEVPSCSFRHLRSGSPWPRASILITSAPNSAISRAANGAAIRVPISITLIPLNGAVMGCASYSWNVWPRLEDSRRRNPTVSWQAAFVDGERLCPVGAIQIAIAANPAPTDERVSMWEPDLPAMRPTALVYFSDVRR